MKLKESYTLEELCSGLSITLKKFCQMAGITEGTLINLRQGYAGRPSTINSVLNTFSKVYGIDFSLENVSGLTLQDKPHQRGKKPPTEEKPIPATSQPEDARIRNVGRKGRTWKQPKKESSLPDGCILYSDFAKSHGLPPTTFRDHMLYGLGPGLYWKEGVEPDDIAAMKERVKYEEREKPNRPKEKERYLTQDQQKAALEFWDKYHVDYSVCDNPDCPCHTVKGE